MAKLPHVKIEIDYDKCVGCGTCVEECPVQMYTLEEKGKGIKKTKIVKNPETDCELCRMCEMLCPSQAIKVIEIYED